MTVWHVLTKAHNGLWNVHDNARYSSYDDAEIVAKVVAIRTGLPAFISSPLYVVVPETTIKVMSASELLEKEN